MAKKEDVDNHFQVQKCQADKKLNLKSNKADCKSDF